MKDKIYFLDSAAGIYSLICKHSGNSIEIGENLLEIKGGNRISIRKKVMFLIGEHYNYIFYKYFVYEISVNGNNSLTISRLYKELKSMKSMIIFENYAIGYSEIFLQIFFHSIDNEYIENKMLSETIVVVENIIKGLTINKKYNINEYYFIALTRNNIEIYDIHLIEGFIKCNPKENHLFGDYKYKVNLKVEIFFHLL